MATMKAVRLHAFGGPEVLSLDEVELPQPRDDEVVLRVCASSVNPVDYKMRNGGYVGEDKLPCPIGRDVSGVVELCGTAAHTLRKGDPIYAGLGFERGGNAQYVLVKATEASAKPESLDHLQAAAVPLAGLTAWQGLFDHGRLERGQRVLIHGGSGGVGHLAVQIAKAAGAFVATTCSGRNREFVEGLGADQVVDYRTERFEEAVAPVDLVLDLVAGEPQERSWSVLKPGGTLVSALGEPSQEQAEKHRARGVGFLYSPNGGQLAELGRLIDEGRVRPHVEATYPLDRVGEAQQHLEQGHVRGKVVLQVAA